MSVLLLAEFFNEEPGGFADEDDDEEADADAEDEVEELEEMGEAVSDGTAWSSRKVETALIEAGPSLSVRRSALLAGREPTTLTL